MRTQHQLMDASAWATAVAAESGAPALVAHIYDSDAALLAADSPNHQLAWRSWLCRSVAYGSYAPDEQAVAAMSDHERTRLGFAPYEQIALRVASWAAEAGHTVGSATVQAALRAPEDAGDAFWAAVHSRQPHAVIEDMAMQSSFAEDWVARLATCLGINPLPPEARWSR